MRIALTREDSLSKSISHDGGLSIGGLSYRLIRRSAGIQIVFVVIIAQWMIAACNPIPALAPAPSQVFTPTASSTTSHTTTPNPTSTATPSPTPTLTPTITLMPSITPTPTEDLSFYNVAACLPQNTIYQRGTVTNVIDGDTIEVRIGNESTNIVRYIGIDSPEIDYPFFDEAKKANSDLVLQKEIVLVKDQSDVDQYERQLRYVIVDKVFVNQQLVKEGFARSVNYPPDEACKDTFTSTELEARQDLAGMWVPTQTPEPSAGQVIILTVNKRDEWVEIQNMGNYDVDLAGWNLVSERGNQDCPLSGIIKAGEILRIWAMATLEPGYSCGYNSPIWNNSEPDPAVLYNAQGVEVSRK